MNHNQKSPLHKAIMRRIYAMFIVRTVFSEQMFVLAGFVLSLFLVKSFVFVRAVFDNMPAIVEPSAFVSFWSSAVSNTELSVQVVLLAIGVFGVIAIKDIVKFFKMRSSYAHGILR